METEEDESGIDGADLESIGRLLLSTYGPQRPAASDQQILFALEQQAAKAQAATEADRAIGTESRLDALRKQLEEQSEALGVRATITLGDEESDTAQSPMDVDDCAVSAEELASQRSSMHTSDEQSDAAEEVGGEREMPATQRVSAADKLLLDRLEAEDRKQRVEEDRVREAESAARIEELKRQLAQLSQGPS